MTHERDIDRVLDQWMGDGPTVVADRVIATAMTDIHTTRQRSAPWTLLKELSMTLKPAMTILAIVAIAAAALAAVQILSGGGGIGAPRVLSPADLPSIALNSTNAPEGWSIDGTVEGEDARVYPIRSDPSWGRSEATAAGYVDGQAIDFCTSGDGCGTSWVALYSTEAAADSAFGVFATEFRLGWNLAPQTANVPNGLGDERRVFHDGLKGATAPALVYLWRVDNLLLGVAGVGGLEGDALLTIAEAMDARAR